MKTKQPKQPKQPKQTIFRLHDYAIRNYCRFDRRNPKEAFNFECEQTSIESSFEECGIPKHINWTNITVIEGFEYVNQKKNGRDEGVNFYVLWNGLGEKIHCFKDIWGNQADQPNWIEEMPLNTISIHSCSKNELLDIFELEKIEVQAILKKDLDWDSISTIHKVFNLSTKESSNKAYIEYWLADEKGNITSCCTTICDYDYDDEAEAEGLFYEPVDPADVYDDGYLALERLVKAAQEDNEQSKYITAFLLGLYDSKQFPFALKQLQSLEGYWFEDCLLVLKMDYKPLINIQEYFDDGENIWQSLIKSYCLNKTNTGAPLV